MDPTRELFEAGYEPVILDGKVPIFRNWPDRLYDLQELLWWKGKGKNIGIKLRGLVDVDKDVKRLPRKAYDWLRFRRAYRSLMGWTSKRGAHDLFRLPVDGEEVNSSLKHLGLPVDLLTGNRCAVAPGGVVDGFIYELREGAKIVRPEELPLFPIDILQKRKEVRVQASVILSLPDDRATRYVDKIDAAVSGEGGSRQTIVACLKILSLTDGDLQRAWPLLVRYNARCEPPWDTEAEEGPDSLRRKLREARKYWTPRR